jgi:hypothetical protein
MRHLLRGPANGLSLLFLLGAAGCDLPPEAPTATPPTDATLRCDAAAAGVQWVGAVESIPDDGCPFERFCGVDEYIALPDLAPDVRLNLSDDQVDAELLALLGGQMPSLFPMEATDLAEAILDATHIDLLTEGLRERPLEVRVLEEGLSYRMAKEQGWWGGRSPNPNMPYQQLLVTDPLVGTFEMVVFRPPLEQGDGPFPVLVVAHGHNDNAWIHMDRDGFGEAFTSAGYVLVAPSFRANDGEMPEHTVTRELLKAGWSMMAIRVYEQLLARRVAASLPLVDGCAPVGLIGHSGGSVASALTVRVAEAPLAFDAYINDLESQYINWDMNDGWTLDETTPGLWPLQHVINEFETLPFPSMAAGYGYPEGLDILIDFFDDSL